MASALQPGLASTSLFDDGVLQDPYPNYRRCLAEKRVHRIELGPRMWAVFRYADCAALMRDHRLSSNRRDHVLALIAPEHRESLAELPRALGRWMLFLDAPEHTRLRKLMNVGFSPKLVEGWRSRIEAVVDRLLDPLRPGTQVDVLQALAYPLPAYVIAEVLGVPADVSVDFLKWSDALALFAGNPGAGVEPARAALRAMESLTRYFRGAVAERRRRKTDGLLSHLISIEEDGDILTEAELYAQCVMLLFGGHETTRNLIGNGVATLLRHAQALHDLRADASLTRSAVEELLRYESPVQMLSRIATADIELGEATVAAGDRLFLVLAAANRDPARFTDPDQLDLRRSDNLHLAFNIGAHYCIGSQLARMDGQIAIRKLIDRFPTMRLADGAPEWSRNFVLRGLRSLPVVL